MEAGDFNRRAADALVRARTLVGDRKSAPFARRLREKFGAPSDTSYLRWESLKQEVPAWALLAAADVAGVALQDLLGEEVSRPLVERLDHVEELSAQNGQQIQRLTDLIERLSSGPSGP